MPCSACDFYAYEMPYNGCEIMRTLLPRDRTLPVVFVREPFAHVKSQLNHFLLLKHNKMPPNVTLQLWNGYIYDGAPLEQPPLGYNPFNLQTIRLADHIDSRRPFRVRHSVFHDVADV